jgi:hypothetical protein
LILSIVPCRNYLTSFCIDKVHLDESPDTILDDDEYFGQATVTIKNMHNACGVRQILDLFGASSKVHLTRCRLPEYSCTSKHLSLKAIDEGEDLVEFLRACTTTMLVIDDCPGFNDAVLDAMTKPARDTPPRKSWSCAQYLQGLSIINCLNFSISALKQLLETRQGKSTWSPAFLPVLRPTGRVPVVSSEDRDWFKRGVSQFSYNPMP